MQERKKCKIESCNRLRVNKGSINGSKIYRTVCAFHRSGMSNTDISELFKQKKELVNKKCSHCGWVGPCDRDKIIPSKGYIKENVRILCPNCHRLVTLGILKI